MERKRICLTRQELSRLSDSEAGITARAISGVVSNFVGSKYNATLAAASSGEIDSERYTYVGLEWLEFIIQYGRLSREGSILDIGCGSGRMAEPLSHYLSSSGTYHGFDISSETMNFCRSLISHPGFSFTSINLHHPIYNPSGKIKPEKFSFPFKDDTFDVAIAASIFSHLGLAAAKRYLAELRRVLRPGGRAIISFFAVPEQEKQTQGGITNILGAGDGEYAYRFLKVENGYYIHCDKTGTPKSHYVNSPEGDPVAFDADALIGLAKEVELDCLHFLEGAWKFTEYVHGWQDIVVLQKHDAD